MPVFKPLYYTTKTSYFAQIFVGLLQQISHVYLNIFIYFKVFYISSPGYFYVGQLFVWIELSISIACKQ